MVKTFLRGHEYRNTAGRNARCVAYILPVGRDIVVEDRVFAEFTDTTHQKIEIDDTWHENPKAAIEESMGIAE